MGIYASDTIQHDEGDIGVDAAKTSQDDKVEMGIGAANTTETLLLLETTGARKKFSSSSAKAEDKRSEASSGASKEAASSSLNGLKDSSSSMLVRSNEIPGNDKSVKYLNKYVPRPGKAVAKVQKRARLISQRRSITEEEKVDAVERAMRFKSKRPFTQQIMKNCHAYTAFFLVLPYEFVQKYLPKLNMKMTLWDPQGKQWEVSYVYFNGYGAFGAGSGWGAFAMGNYLEKFDMCVFELLHENNIKVHIYRVVIEITPCILSSDDK